MQIVTARTETSSLQPWLDQWFEPWNEALNEALSEGRPHPTLWSGPERLAGLQRHDPARASVVLAAVEGDGVLGGARIDLPQHDNLGLAELLIAVRPAARRRGVGGALAAAVRSAAADEGRTSMMTVIERPADVVGAWPGESFATEHGLTMRQRNLRRDLSLPVHRERLEALASEVGAASRDYDVRTWEGPTADPARQAALTARMSTDAPLGDLEYESESWDADRVVQTQERHQAKGRRWWTSIAVDTAGDWVGFSEIGWSLSQPDRLWQWDTLVLAEHRGHRLGLALKVATLEVACAAVPQAQVVHPWNAESNAPMVAVNVALGFEVTEVLGEWQGPV